MAISSNLFQPITVGRMQLSHRVVLSPMVRFRNDSQTGVILPIAKKYFTQRGSRPGTFLITESGIISARLGGMPMPLLGFWSDEQISAWKEIVDAVHAQGSYIFLQVAALGRRAYADSLKAVDPSYDVIAPSSIPRSDGFVPREMTLEEIKETVESYRVAVRKAVEIGFDGVEIHGANGCLSEQFLQDVTNNRTDQYGGSIENRARFLLEVIDAVTKVIGADRIGLKLSPWFKEADMGMADPKPTYSYLVSELKARHPDLAYLHVTEARHALSADGPVPTKEGEDNEFLRQIWSPKVYMSAGCHTRETAYETTASNPNELIAFGRPFLANPDLPTRLERNIPLNITKDKSTYYIYTDGQAEQGYTDYPNADMAAY